MKPTKEEMFDWIIQNQIQIEYHYPLTWEKEDGSKFSCNFTISTPKSRFSAAPTIEEAIIEAMEIYQNGEWL